MKKFARTGSVAFVVVLAMLAFAGMSTGMALAQDRAPSDSSAVMSTSQAEVQTITGSVVVASKAGPLVILADHSGEFIFFEVATEAYSSLMALQPGDSVTVRFVAAGGEMIAESIDKA